MATEKRQAAEARRREELDRREREVTAARQRNSHLSVSPNVTRESRGKCDPHMTTLVTSDYMCIPTSLLAD